MLLLGATLGPASPAVAADCPTTPTETTKFVQDLLHQGTATGVMGTIWAYDRDPDCNGTAAASTVFLRLDDSYLEFAETGLYYSYSSGDARPRVFGEWRVFPAGIGRTIDSGRQPLDAFYGFNLSPVGNGSWKWQMSPGLSQTNWVTYGYTPQFATPSGTPESESARYTYANGLTYQVDLKYRPSSGWFGWGHLGCDYAQRSMNDYHAVRYTNQSWANLAGAPQGGEC